MDFRITEGDTPTVNDTLLNADGSAFDLTGYTVKLEWQGPVTSNATATLVNAAAGTVRYQFLAAQTAAPGEYTAQWKATKDAEVHTFPTVPLRFDIVPRVPVTAPSQMSLLTDFIDPVRAILGDFNTTYRKYQDSAITGVLRTMLRMGKVPGYSLSTDARSVSPAIGNDAVRAFALLVYHASLTLLNPNAASYSYRTRAMGETFGNQRDFVRDLQNALYDLEFGEMFVSYQSYYSWMNGMAGQNIWAVLSEMTPPQTLNVVTLTGSGTTVS
jgi:hypothetical protein